MNTAEATRYLVRMYGENTGHVAVAYKHGEKWGERSFEWPAQRAQILSWAKDQTDRGSNVFICPALRKHGGVRKKGDGIALRWLWADVDMAGVPDTARDAVRARMAKLGTVVVASGTPGNAHVYVKLKRDVTPDEHERLNKGLRDFLHADNKHTDEALLRLPGTFNQKGSKPARVVVEGGHKGVIDPAKLEAHKVWQAVTVTGSDDGGGGNGWKRVDIKPLLKGRIRALCRMSGDEAASRYGARYRAVTAVTKELVKRKFDRDQIHSLMDAFPPGVEKAEDEHGAYDIHKDIDRLIIRSDRSNASGETKTDDDQEVFSDVDDSGSDQPSTDESVAAELARREVKRKADQIEAQARFIAPPPDVSWSVAEGFKNPPVRQKYLIDRLAGAKHNVMLIAQYKTGKTTFVVSNLARALCDGVPFLDEFDAGPGVVVGHWNCEMDPDELLEEYIRPADMKHPENMHVANLRGYSVNILSGVGKAWAIDWLKTRNVAVWTIDSLARLARMAGVNENDNHEMLNLLMTVDDIKLEAGVDVSFTIAHTGRGEMEEGNERARAATVIDDWPDARWIMTRDGDVRFLSVDGRGVKLPVTTIHFDEGTRHMTMGIGGKVEARTNAGVEAVVDLVTENPGILNAGTLKKALREKFPNIKRDAVFTELVREAVDLNRIVEKAGVKPREKLYWPAEGKVIDFSKVSDRTAGRGRPGGTVGRGAGVARVKATGK